jgi:hypothetical protein
MRLDDGFSTTIDFGDFPSVQFFEKTVTIPGMDGGGPNDTTTMRNDTLRTRAPKKLKSMTEMTSVVSYDPEVFDVNAVWAMINVNQLITINFPDSSHVVFYGWLNSFIPGELREGEQPTATISVQCSNQDPTGIETPPQWIPA